MELALEYGAVIHAILQRRRVMRFGVAIVVCAMFLAVFSLFRSSRLLAGAAVTPSAATVPSREPDWLQGDVDSRFQLVAKHLRGFDVAMAEVGHRYVELYWAGQDRNWAYAAYQLAKIETAVANGVERRPKRAASARMLDAAVIGMRAAIVSTDRTSFDRAFAVLTETCNACHSAERVPFITVAQPNVRLSPVRGAPNVPSRETSGAAP
jgi:hypothetical protein